MAVPAARRLAELERVLQRLQEALLEGAAIVEGPRDEAALRDLGIDGPVHQLHEPGSVLDLADKWTQDPRPLVILTDWDRKGGQLARRLREALHGRIRVDHEIRRDLAKWSHVKCVEHVPADLAQLRQSVTAGRH